MISNKCKYAIRALTYISSCQHREGGVVSSEIAAAEQIPKKFLETILRELRNNRILNSKRGKEGGYTLLRKPAEISMTEIMRIMDGPIAMLPCVSLNYYASCDECQEETCRIKGVFEQVRDRTLEILNATTLETLIQKKP